MIALHQNAQKIVAVTQAAPEGVNVPIGGCTSALCQCGEVKLTFPGPRGPQPAFLDPFARAASPNADPADAAFSAEVAAELTPESWSLLTDVVLAWKRLDMDAVDAGKGTWTFDESAVELRGAMVPYTEVFRFSTPALVMLNGQDCYVDESYCVRPECPCTEVAVAVVPRSSPTGGAVFPLAELYFDYHRGTARVHPQRPVTAGELQAICQTLVSQNPAFPNNLAVRHQRMQALYTRSRRGVAAMSRPQVGRNDPCPCGSGAKYKKCCGA